MRVRGTVQGVGFRPWVYRVAAELELSGWVGNDGRGVVIEVEGPVPALDGLLLALHDRPPPLALIEQVDVAAVPVTGEQGFRVVLSAAGEINDARVSADVAPCQACLAEMADPADRRFGYPFVNCTDCGPRYTIVCSVPYDRPATTMAAFPMCAACQAEYDDPADRRFHAQPIACPVCGPTLSWSGGQGMRTGPAALAAAVDCLLDGGIVAVKGVGGYHLACDATDPKAVAELRRRKARPDKPFAVMVADERAARRLCVLHEEATQALGSAQRPIVLAPRRLGSAVAQDVAPRLPDLGVMLPSSPLHVLLLELAGRPLVMTSGNPVDEPVLHLDAEARARLGPLVEGLLEHNRPIHVRADDSVARSLPDGSVQLLRRARGWVPQPLRLPIPAEPPVLAVGAHLKSTVALAQGGSMVVSQHLGDLSDWPTYAAFTAAVEHLVHLSGTQPTLVAHDLHPDYRSTQWAVESGLPLLGVQHHHAHIASCLVEHGVTTPVLGIAFDGTGLGDDGTLWGGEFLVADLRTSLRVGHLRSVGLPGGEAAVREPWRTALSWVHRALGPDAAARQGARLDHRWPAMLSLISSGSALETTSVGRLFDGVAALLGVTRRVTYEGQAAVELEALARQATTRGKAYEVAVDGDVLDPAPALAALLADRDSGVGSPDLAAGFHRGLAQGTAALAVKLAAEHGVDTVALSGGVFQNVLISAMLTRRLRAAGLRVLEHRQVPPNDGSISIGQAAVAAARYPA